MQNAMYACNRKKRKSHQLTKYVPMYVLLSLSLSLFHFHYHLLDTHWLQTFIKVGWRNSAATNKFLEWLVTSLWNKESVSTNQVVKAVLELCVLLTKWWHISQRSQRICSSWCCVSRGTVWVSMDHFILAPGGVGSIMEHVTKFLGRTPQQDHFLASRGIIPSYKSPQ